MSHTPDPTSHGVANLGGSAALILISAEARAMAVTCLPHTYSEGC